MSGEIVYINGGEIYKSNIYFAGAPGEGFNYVSGYTDDPVAPMAHFKPDGVKIYEATREMREWVSNDTSGESLSGYDLCPAVTLWIGRAYFTNGVTDVDLYFRVESAEQLRAIAAYYDLPYPIDEHLEKTLTENPAQISMYRGADESHAVCAGIKIVGGVPSLLKFYCAYKDGDDWLAIQKGRVFANGKVVEEGAQYVMSRMATAQFKYESTTSHTTTEYFPLSSNDPLANWEARIKNLETGAITTKHFESSRQLRRAAIRYDTGSDYEDYNKAPQVTWWLGRSWIEGGEEELFFHIDSRAMLDAVAAHYNLPAPYPTELVDVLDNNIQKIRFKSYDLNQAGEGNFVEVVVGGVVFNQGAATMLKLYEVTRWNE